jgi:hypothetical protein
MENHQDAVCRCNPCTCPTCDCAAPAVADKHCGCGPKCHCGDPGECACGQA